MTLLSYFHVSWFGTEIWLTCSLTLPCRRHGSPSLETGNEVLSVRATAVLEGCLPLAGQQRFRRCPGRAGSCVVSFPPSDARGRHRVLPEAGANWHHAADSGPDAGGNAAMISTRRSRHHSAPRFLHPLGAETGEDRAGSWVSRLGSLCAPVCLLSSLHLRKAAWAV